MDNCAPPCQISLDPCACDTNLGDFIDLNYIADTILEVCKSYGFQVRFRQNLSDFDPVTIWVINNTVEEDVTTLRDGASTDKSTISLLIPRQEGLNYTDQLPIGALIEKDLGTNIWHLVEDVVYSAGESSVSPSLVAYISYVEDDPQNIYDPDVTGGDHPTETPETATGTAPDPANQYDINGCEPCSKDPVCTPDQPINQLVDVCNISAAMNLLICGVKYGPMRFRNNLLDVHPITINATIVANERTRNGLRDYNLTGRNSVGIIAPQQTLFPLYTLYNTKTSFTQPGALVEIQYGSGQWWMVDRVVLSGRNPANSPLFTLFLSWTPQDPDGLNCLSVSSIEPDFGPLVGGTEVIITGFNFTNNMAVKFNGVSGVITNINIDPDDLNGLCSLNVISPPSDVSGDVSLLIRNQNLGSTCNVEDSFVYTLGDCWVDADGIAWSTGDTGETCWSD